MPDNPGAKDLSFSEDSRIGELTVAQFRELIAQILRESEQKSSIRQFAPDNRFTEGGATSF